jgi:hypothetical protein
MAALLSPPGSKLLSSKTKGGNAGDDDVDSKRGAGAARLTTSGPGDSDL